MRWNIMMLRTMMIRGEEDNIENNDLEEEDIDIG